jgi:hypothetical protein
VAALAGAEQVVKATEPVIFLEVFSHTAELDAF